MKLNKSLWKKSFALTDNETDSLCNLADTYLVLYFYPKDNTPGCTQEGKDFAELHQQFKKKGVNVVGVSRDTAKKHDNFKTKFDFPFPLLADTDSELCEAFEVMKEKSLYGKKYIGIERSTFLIDANGKIIKEWRNVKVPGHAQAVLDCID